MAIKRIIASGDLLLPPNTKIASFTLSGAAVSTLKLFNGTQAAGAQISLLNIAAGTAVPVIYVTTQLVTGGLSATITGAGAEAYVEYE